MRRLMYLLTTALLIPVVQAHPGGHGEDRPGTRNVPTSQVETAYGRPGKSSDTARSIPIVMGEGGRCAPDSISVKQGEIVKFAVRNTGKQLQEVAVGTAPELKAHAEAVRKFPGMQVSRVNRASAREGQSVDLVWQFTRPGEFLLACGPSGQFSETGAARVTVNP